ncbi:hypothetical protein [Chloracidobacterium thermophilum]|uniref:hypothetical protein n=1 Tax=Chloracidobacterium thermophilum TaxID=458033 RepID=UPI00073879C8|nr:hypothetical protein [Chloracidobacterium thermophilum]
MGYQKRRGVFRPPHTPPAIAERAGLLTRVMREFIAETDKRLAEINDAIVAGGLPSYEFRRLKREQGELLGQRKRLNAEMECISRLVNDPRMQEVYELLEAEGFDDRDQRGFFLAVLSTPTDFKGPRRRVKEARRLSRQIARTAEKMAEKLAKQIRELGNLRCDIPRVLISTQELLKQSDNSRHPALSVDWERLRLFLLEQLPDSNDDVRRAWEVAPGLEDLLTAVARLCREFEPRPYGCADVVRSRKSGEKSERIRSLANRVTKYFGFALTPRLKRAMAIALTVHFNDPNDEVSYEHVRKIARNLLS